MRILLFLLCSISLNAQSPKVKTKIINNGVIHASKDGTYVHTVDEKCVGNTCTYTCRECSFKMEKIKQVNKYSPRVQAMLDSIPDDRAYCPLCSCPRCANIILGLYKGISYEESISKEYKVVKLTNLSPFEEDVKAMFFYKQFPELDEMRKNCQ